jgi:hypothetical protein
VVLNLPFGSRDRIPSLRRTAGYRFMARESQQKMDAGFHRHDELDLSII